MANTSPLNRGVVRALLEPLFVSGHETWRQELTLTHAEALLVERCIRRKGYEITHPRQSAPGIDGRVWPWLAYRRALGYGGKVKGHTSDLPPEGSRRERDVARAYFGNEDHQIAVPTPVGGNTLITVEGCWGEIRRTLWGGIRNTVEGGIASDYAWVAGGWVDQQPERVASLRRWHRCMTQLGYTYRTPSDPYYEFTQDWASDPVTSREIRTAVDDANCQIAARGPQTVTRLMHRWMETHLTATDWTRLDRSMALRQRALVRADALLRQAGER